VAKLAPRCEYAKEQVMTYGELLSEEDVAADGRDEG
jgi:hypothetical protein